MEHQAPARERPQGGARRGEDKNEPGEKEYAMMKHNMGRLIAAILTMAMAFTVLAVPASAANWAIEVDNVSLGDEGEKVTIVISNQAIPQLIQTVKEQADGELDKISGLLDLAGKIASSNLGKMVLSLSSSLLEQVNAQLDGDTKLKVYDGAVPKNAYIGIIGTDSSTTSWYDKATTEKVVDAVVSGENTSVKIAADGTLTVDGKTVDPIPESELKWGNNTLLYVGAAVAVAGAATGIYFYTHPAAWNKVTTCVKNTWNKLTGKATEEAPADTAEESADTAAEGTPDEATTAEDAQTPDAPTEEAAAA
jgi:hypothetical protein